MVIATSAGADAATAGGAVLGVDVGGTFVDFALAVSDAPVTTHKVLADHRRLAACVIDGLAELAKLRGGSLASLLEDVRLIVHGTTVATNAVLTHSGARTSLLTTAGTRDALEMRRGIKEEPLDNRYEPPPPLVPRRRRLGVEERVDAAGTVLIPLAPAAISGALRALERERPEAVAICLMHAYDNPVHEQQLARELATCLPGVYVTASADLMPQLGYYARVSTTVLNSYVGPLLETYLGALSEALTEAGFRGGLLIMNSSGGVMTPDAISRRAAAALVSGPAAGPIAGSLYAGRHERAACVVIDMGGTSLDVSLVADGKPVTTNEGRIGRYSVALPMVDVRTLPIGGGSIGWVDRAAVAHVGPQSAGASPGPACYGLGGQRPTCTDANVVLGYIDPGYFLGGRVGLDPEAAAEALRAHVAEPLGLSVEEAAVVMLELVNTGVAAGVRDMLVDHGLSPEGVPLVVGGGAAAIHAGMVATELGVAEVIVPRMSGVLCASGMLFTDLRHDYVHSYICAVEDIDHERWRSLMAAMVDRGRAAIADADAKADPEASVVTYAADVRYARQLHDLTIPLDPAQAATPDPVILHALFDAAHDRMFGYSLPDHPLEVVNLRVTCVGRLPRPKLTEQPSGGEIFLREPRRAYMPGEGMVEWPVLDGQRLGDGARFDGPVIVDMPQTTIVVPPGMAMRCDAHGSLLLSGAPR